MKEQKELSIRTILRTTTNSFIACPNNKKEKRMFRLS